MALRYRIPGTTHRRPLRPIAQTDVGSQPAVQEYRHQQQIPINGFHPTPPNARHSGKPPSPNRQRTFYL